ncbi:MAG: YitT family protein [Paenibacillaceae bacterium]
MSLYMRKINILVAGSLLIAIGVDFFLIPFKVLDGGIIGLALILKYTWGMQVGFSMFICSAPIFVLAWFQYRPLFLNSIYGLMLSSFFISYLDPLQYHFLYYVELSAITSAIVGGAGIGAGIGIMLRFETSTGGTDLLAQYLSKLTFLNVGLIIMLMDLMIIAIGGLLISMETFLLSLITITVGGIVTGFIAMK